MNIRKILFPTDFSGPSNRALDHAIILAHRFKATLMMLHIEVPYASDPYNPNYEFPKLEELFATIREQALNRLNDPKLPVVSGDIEIIHEVRRGVSAAPEILSFAHENAIDLIIMGTHGRSGLGHFLLGSTAEKVVHGAQTPVLTIHHGEDKLLEKQGRYEKVLVPIDFSDASFRALQAGTEMAKLFESDLIAVHVIEPILTPQNLFAGDPSPVRIDVDLKDRSKAAFEEFAGEEISKRAKFCLRSGVAHREIVAAISDAEADIVLMADQGWSAVDRWLLGGTTEKVVRKSPVPVMTIK